MDVIHCHMYVVQGKTRVFGRCELAVIRAGPRTSGNRTYADPVSWVSNSSIAAESP
jgi:hypothetical protein